jgi:transmembrane sensor
MSRQHTRTPPQIIDEASEWFVLMREPDVSTESREAFAQWLRASPAHVGVYLEIARLWGDATHIGTELGIDDPSPRAPNVVDLPTASRELSHPGDRRHDTARRLLTRSRWAASIIGFTFAVAIAGWHFAGRAPTYATDIGEQRVITLEDGSTVRLNSRSEVSVRMSAEQRRVELIAGQALFQVAHDAARPFIVTSDSTAIRAVGTQFDVNRRQSGTVVTVVEGKVSIDSVEPSILSRLFESTSAPFESTPAPALSSPETESRDNKQDPPAKDRRVAVGEAANRELLLVAGEQLLLAQNGTFERMARPDSAAAISWLQQELRFDGQPLIDVLEEFNRYTRTPIVLADPSLGTLRISAVFHTTNPDSLLKFISRMDNMQIERSAKQIRISKRS